MLVLHQLQPESVFYYPYYFCVRLQHLDEPPNEPQVTAAHWRSIRENRLRHRPVFWIQYSAPDKEAVRRNQWNIPSLFFTLSCIKVRGGSPESDRVTTIRTIYQSEQWCDFIEPSDATFAVIAAALVPTPPRRDGARKNESFDTFYRIERASLLQKSSSFFKHILFGWSGSSALWPCLSSRGSCQGSCQEPGSNRRHRRLISALDYSIARLIFSLFGGTDASKELRLVPTAEINTSFWPHLSKRPLL